MDSEEVNGVDAETPIPACIRFFRKGPNDYLLVAATDPSEDFPAGIAVNIIEDWIRSQGCDGWFLHEQAISQLSMEMRRLEDAKEYVVAERKNCQVEVQAAPDRLKAWVRISPAFGGESLTDALLRQALKEHNICFGIKEDKLKRIVQDGACEKEVIAEGIPPIHGKNTKFEPLVLESTHKGAPQEHEDGTVDYKDLGIFLSVTKGTPLLRRIPPTIGTPGTGIDGASIPACPGTDRSPHPGIGTALSEEDPDIIMADRAGQPSFIDNSARVDPTLEIDTVDPSTGNVSFDGNIIIRGPVESGFSVQAGQDLTILDTVEGANLTAGKNMVLLTGVYGKGKTKISVEGNLEAKFLSDCDVYCGGNIEVSDLIAHCFVECSGTVSLGKCGGKGQFFGGKLLALGEVWAQLLGSVSEATTLVEIGRPRALMLRQDGIEKAISAIRQELEIIGEKLKSKGNSPADRKHPGKNNLKEKSIDLAGKLDELKKEQETIQQKLGKSHRAKIRASQVHRGVILCIGSLRQTVSDLITDLCFQPPAEEKQEQPN